MRSVKQITIKEADIKIPRKQILYKGKRHNVIMPRIHTEQ